MNRRLGLTLLCAALAAGCGGGSGERALRKGNAALEAGRYVQAKAAFQKALDAMPSDPRVRSRALNNLGVASSQLGEVQAAAESFEESHRLDPEFVDPIYNLGVLLHRAGDFGEAETLLERAARLPANDPRPLEYLASIHLGQSRWNEARQCLLRALDRTPSSPRLLTALAIATLKSAGAEESIAYLMQALDADSEYAPALYNLALIYDREANDTAQALAFYRQAADRMPPGERADAARSRMAELSKGVEQIAAPLAARDRPRPPEPPSASDAARRLLDTATRKAAAGSVREAVEICRRAAAMAARASDAALQESALRKGLELGPDQGIAFFEWGRFLEARGDAAGALKAYRQASSLEANNAGIQRALARLAQQSGDREGAILALRNVVRLETADADALWTLAQTYEQARMTADAERTYRDFERIFPGDARVLKARERIAPAPRTETPALRTGTQPNPPTPPRSGPNDSSAQARQAMARAAEHHRNQDWTRAAEQYRRAAELDPSNASALYYLGVAEQALGRAEAARGAYTRALALDANQHNARYNLALIEYQTGRENEALFQLRRLVGIQPGYAAAHNLLGVIYSKSTRSRAEAIEHFQRFIELAPNDPYAAAARTWIQQNR